MRQYYVEYNVFRIVNCKSSLLLTANGFFYFRQLTVSAINHIKNTCYNNLMQNGIEISNLEVQIVSVTPLEEDY